VVHSEFNASKTEPLHLMQIWIVPDKTGVTPRYEDRVIPDEERHNRLRLLVSPDGADGSIDIHQDVRLYGARLDAWSEVTHTLKPGRHAWLQLASGEVTVNGVTLNTGDAAAISEEASLAITATEDAEILLFDLN
jgi:redox-sensitive bicupin YhaK (pirin superfamily)